MNRLFNTAIAAAALSVSATAFAQTSPYAGEQQRGIKALDARDVTALLRGYTGAAPAAGTGPAPDYKPSHQPAPPLIHHHREERP